MRAVLAHGFLSGCNACAVDQAHQFAQRYCFVDHCLCIGFIADIAAHKSSTDLLGDGFAFFDLHVRDDDSAAAQSQHACSAFAQPRGAAGDDEYFALDFHSVSPG